MSEERTEGIINLINDVYQRARKVSGEVNLNPICKHIRDWLDSNKDIQISRRTIERKIKALEQNDIKSLSGTQGYTLVALCQYVGYNSFADYLDPNVEPNQPEAKQLYQMSFEAKITMSSYSKETVKKIAETLKELFNHESITVNDTSFSETIDKQFAGRKVRYAQKWLLSMTDRDLFDSNINLIEKALKSLKSKETLSIQRMVKNGKIIIFDKSGLTRIFLEIEHSKGR